MTDRIRLLCLPHAGAGTAVFARWRTASSDRLRVEPVLLPGREKRFGEPAATDFAAAMRHVLAEVSGADGSDGGGGEPVALFGHSLGALLAYELARHLQARGVTVARLVVSGAPGPHRTPVWPIARLADDDFVAEVEALTGFTHPALADPVMRGLLLPTLRADFMVHESYEHHAGDLLRAPVTVLRGDTDPIVSRAQAATWAEVTAGGCDVTELAGGHMYLLDRWDEVFSLIENQTTAPVPTAQGASR